MPSTNRIQSLDVLRGVAVCGILLMTICKMGAVTAYPITRFPPAWNAQWIGWGVQTVAVDGTMRGLFTMLFGSSMLLMLRAAEGAGGSAVPLDFWTRRSLALMALGTLLWVVFLWPGEILWTYGISGLMLLAFRTAKPVTLMVAAGVLLAGLSANAGYRSREAATQIQAGAADLKAGRRTDAAAAALAEEARVRPSPAEVERRIEERTHFASLLRWSERFWLGENIGGTGWLEVAESVAFMLIGMSLFRTGLLTGGGSGRTWRQLMLVGYGIGLPLRLLPVWLGARTGLDVSSVAVDPRLWALADALFEPGRLGMTLGHLGAILWLLRAGWLGRAATLQALGRMALTVYMLQAIMGSILFYGLGLVGRFALPGLWVVAVLIWIATALFSRWWLARFEMGPAEALLRGIARGELRRFAGIGSLPRRLA